MRWGIDLGGTKIEGAVISSVDPLEVVVRERIPTEADRGYEHIIGQITKMIDLLSAKTGERPTSIGIGTPGAIDPGTGLMKNANTTCLIGKPMNKDLEQHLGLEVRMANDANCFAIAETLLGGVKERGLNVATAFGVILGTGVGGGVVIGDHVIGGKHGIGGEWGHNFLDESGGECYCGRTGCVETNISGPALERYYRRITGEQKALRQIVEDARKGESASILTMDRFYHLFGKAIANVINILDPDVIIIGGGLSNIPELYTRGPEEALPHVFNDRIETPFIPPTLGDSAGVFGAALLK